MRLPWLATKGASWKGSEVLKEGLGEVQQSKHIIVKRMLLPRFKTCLAAVRKHRSANIISILRASWFYFASGLHPTFFCIELLEVIWMLKMQLQKALAILCFFYFNATQNCTKCCRTDSVLSLSSSQSTCHFPHSASRLVLLEPGEREICAPSLPLCEGVFGCQRRNVKQVPLLQCQALRNLIYSTGKYCELTSLWL